MTLISMDILTVLILLIPEQGISFHLFGSSSIYFIIVYFFQCIDLLHLELNLSLCILLVLLLL